MGRAQCASLSACACARACVSMHAATPAPAAVSPCARLHSNAPAVFILGRRHAWHRQERCSAQVGDAQLGVAFRAAPRRPRKRAAVKRDGAILRKAAWLWAFTLGVRVLGSDLGAMGGVSVGDQGVVHRSEAPLVRARPTPPGAPLACSGAARPVLQSTLTRAERWGGSTQPAFEQRTVWSR